MKVAFAGRKTPTFQNEALFSNYDLKQLLIPLMIEQALALSIGLFDTIMVSTLGEAAISGVSLVDSVNILLIQVFAALATGGAVVTSQYIGRRSVKEAKNSANQLISIVLVVSVAISLLVIMFQSPLLHLVFGSIDADVMQYARTYLWLSALGYPFVALYNAGASLFRAQGNSKVSMVSSLTMNVFNIAGNALLIFGFGLGVFGAALASLVARIVATAVVFYLLQAPTNPLRLDSWRDLLPQKQYIQQILKIGIPSAIENGMFQFGRLAVSGLSSTLGTAALAANAITSSVVTILNVPCSAIGLAIITVVGQCLGAHEKEQAKYYSNRLLCYALASIWAFNVPCLLFGQWVMPLFNLSLEAKELSIQLLFWYNLVSLVAFVPSFTMSNSLRSAGDAKFTMWVSVFSMWTFRVISSYWFVGMGFGMFGIWIGMWIDWAFRGLFYSARYFSWKWLDKRVI